MTKILVDAGTSWSKILEIYSPNDDLENSPLNNYIDYIHSENVELKDIEGNRVNGRYFIMSSSQLSKTNLVFDKATGHMIKNMLRNKKDYENEVISLALGAQKILPDLKDATVVDLGSRDAKWVRFKDGKYTDLDWNGACGSATGATVEMLCKFYNINPSEIDIQDSRYPVTCGVFAMEKIMDDIAKDVPAEVAVSKYIHGIAYNTWKFAGKPDNIFLSGGFCLNKCFIESLKLYCEVTPLGRFMLLEGLF